MIVLSQQNLQGVSGDGVASPNGVQATAIVGTVTAFGVGVAQPTGRAMTSAVGAASLRGDAVKSAAGVNGSILVGAPSASGAGVVIAAGRQLSSALGSVTAAGSGSVNAQPQGVVVTASVGSSSISGQGTITATGRALTSSLGTATAIGGTAGDGVANPSGVIAVMSVGTANASASQPVRGGFFRYLRTRYNGTATAKGVQSSAEVGRVTVGGGAGSSVVGGKSTTSTGVVSTHTTSQASDVIWMQGSTVIKREPAKVIPLEPRMNGVSATASVGAASVHTSNVYEVEKEIPVEVVRYVDRVEEREIVRVIEHSRASVHGLTVKAQPGQVSAEGVEDDSEILEVLMMVVNG